MPTSVSVFRTKTAPPAAPAGELDDCIRAHRVLAAVRRQQHAAVIWQAACVADRAWQWVAAVHAHCLRVEAFLVAAENRSRGS